MDKKKQEEATSLVSRINKRIWLWVESVFETFKFKESDLWYHKTLKFLLRVVSILILIALSPLILVTIILIIALAS